MIRAASSLIFGGNSNDTLLLSAMYTSFCTRENET